MVELNKEYIEGYGVWWGRVFEDTTTLGQAELINVKHRKVLP